MRTGRFLTVAVLAAATFTMGCSRQRASAPDVTGQIRDSLKANNLDAVKVREDRDKGVVTLSGNLPSDQLKMRAEDIGKQNAGGMIVADEIGVRPQGEESAANKIDKNLDKGIEDNYRAAITANGLDNQHIHYDVKNGVITLKGDVDTFRERDAAEKVAASVPNVTQVVNELQMKNAGRAHRRAPAGE